MSGSEIRIVGDDGGPLPALGGLDDDFVDERASASPASPVLAHDPIDIGAASGAPLQPLRLSLLEAQQWFAMVVTHEGSVEAGISKAGALVSTAPHLPTAEQLIARGPRLDATAQLGVYHHAYRARLVECLADDFPIVQRMLGDDAFAGLARRYIAAHPSQSPNLNSFGQQFASFAKTQADGPVAAALVSDLARLEWAMIEVLHAPASPLPSTSELAGLSPEQWAHVRFVPSATLRFLEFGHPVNVYLQQVRTGLAPAPPVAAWSATAVYRDDWKLWRMDFTPAMAGVLRTLLEGESLGVALATLSTAAHADPQMEGDVMSWFRAWMRSGFFSALLIS